jgi:hypothetical protein
MRRSLVVAGLAVFGLLLSSCGGDDVESRVIPEDRLDAALLTVDDLDDGWSEDRRAVFTSRAEGPQAFDSAGWCPQALEDVDGLATIDELSGDTGAAVEFQHERQDARRMFHGISQQVWSNENVPAYFDLVSRVFDVCSGETWSPEADQEVTVTLLESPDLGDESLAVNVVIATPGPDGDYLWSSRIVIVVIDSTLMIIRDLDVQRSGSDPLMSDSEWGGLIDTAMDHFADVVQLTSAEGGFLSIDPFFADVTPAVPIG